MKRFTLILAVVLIAWSTASAQTADTVFMNASVYTMDEANPTAEAVAVRDNMIVYVGDGSGAEAFIGDGTEVFDLDGKMVLPGFVSGHEHLISSGFLSQGVDLVPATSKEQTLELIQAYADANPDKEFILGYGWNADTMGGFPTAADLDAIVPDRPAFLADATIHDSWLNSKAVEMGGITDDTEDPLPGFSYWVRDDQGKILGVGIELAWMPAYVASGAWNAEELITASQERLYRLAAEAGYTAYIHQGLVTPNVNNADVYHDDYKIALNLLKEKEDSGELELRTFIQYFFKDKEAEPATVVDYAVEIRDGFDTDLIRLTGLKIHPEGVALTKTAKMLEPFADDPGNTGARGLNKEVVEEAILLANEAGLDVSIHVEGSQTVRTSIDSILKSKEMGYADARNSLQHFAVVHPDDLQRVLDHKIPVNLTPIWATTWGGGLAQISQLLGRVRTEAFFQQLRSVIGGGTSVSIAADVPSTTPDFMSTQMQCEAAVTRQHPTEPTEVFPPMSQAITLEQCLHAATMGGAYQARMEDKIGSLVEGKYADLVVLERDLFEVAPEEISEVEILATMMDGRFTHRDGI
ncbi:MAG: amidohydrolase [Pseudomonadota bacterium]